MTKILISILFTAILSNSINSQYRYPKREFRGAWIATVANIDWPTSKTSSSEMQKKELIQMLDKLKASGINAVLFQVRTECDALYNSSFEPWSYWLTGEQGKSPSPYYDPLQLAVEESHKRGMELHAWLNPYRAVKTEGEYENSDFHISKTHPEWILTFGNYKMLDPGIPDVRTYINSVVEDIITHYDVDGIHFDDYFYPYSPKVSTEDSNTFHNYNDGFTDIDDWRRYNINSMVSMVHEKINEIKPHIKFGISPFGIVENKYAGTNGFNSYSILYCDPLTWIKEKTVDYVTPQIYWEIGHEKADYSLLLPWWASLVEERHLYIGHFSSSFTAKKYKGKKSEMGDQLRMNQKFRNVKGSVFFSAKSITNNYSGFADTLKNNFYKFPALIPLMDWKDNVPPNPLDSLTLEIDGDYIQLRWEKPQTASDGDEAKYFVIYKFTIDKYIDFENPEYIIAIVSADVNEFKYNCEFQEKRKLAFGVTVLDKVQNESEENPVVYIE